MAAQPPDPGTNLWRSGEVLSESEERFRLLVEGVKDYAIFMLDPEGYVTTWNAGARRIKGYEAGEIIGEHFSVFYTEGDVERSHPARELRIAAAEGQYEEEGIRVRKDGSTFWANVIITALRDDEGNLRGFAKVTRDVTARKEADERDRLLIREQAAREQATSMLESISDAFFGVDREWRFTYVNRRAEELWGRPREDLLGRNLWEAFPRAAGSEIHRQMEHAMENRVTATFGTVSPVLGIPVAGRIYPSREGLSVYFRDVTERVRAEEERARLAAIVDSSDDVIIGKTLEGIITSWNRGAEKTYGYSAGEAVGRHISMLVPPERPDEIPTILESIRRGKKVDHFETVRVAKDGRRLDISLTVSPIRNAAGEIVGASTIARDITERKRAQEAMRQVRETERRRIARDLHDGVLQDLTYAAAAMELTRLKAQGTDFEGELGEEIEALRSATLDLRAAVYDLRLADDLGRSFADGLKLLAARNRAMSPDQEIKLTVEEGFPAIPPGKSGAELLRILQEALSNARRHSGARNVLVTLGTHGEDLVAAVADDGRGFGPETSPGVGLRSMRERASALGGELRIQSQPGRGTTLRLRVPRPAAEDRSSPRTGA